MYNDTFDQKSHIYIQKQIFRGVHCSLFNFQTQKNGWDGPVLGVKQATENKRQFDEEVIVSIISFTIIVIIASIITIIVIILLLI